MNSVTLSDLVLLTPEIILVSIALVLMLLARRIRGSRLPAVMTVTAACGAALSAWWLSTRGQTSGFGGMIEVDAYALFFKFIIAATLASSALLSVPRRAEELMPRPELGVLMLLASTGMMLAVSATDLLTLYLALELTTICAYILVGITVDRKRSNEAALKYFLQGSFASGLLLYGISLTYGITGATDFAGIAAGFETRDPSSDLFLMVAIGLVASGMAFKIAAVPFHAWAPDAYQGASSPVAAFLAAGSKAAGLAALGRVTFVAFQPEAPVLSAVLGGLAGLSIVAGSILALVQKDMKRLLAYSSIAHAGYALLGLMAGGADGVGATMTYSFFYVFMTLGAFGVVVALGTRGEHVDGYRGLASQRPVTAGLMLLFLLSLTGIPPTAGFVAKFAVITSAVRSGHTGLAVLAVLCSVVSAFVYMRIAVHMYMEEPQEEEPQGHGSSVTVALALAASITVLGGIFPGSLTQWAVSP